MKTGTLVLSLIFENMCCYFWMITRMKNVNEIQIAKVQSHGVAQHLLDFLPISDRRPLLIKVLLIKNVCII